MTLLRTVTACLAPARRNVVWLLLAVYALAAFLPATGDELRGLELGQLPFSSGTFNPTHLLLAVLLLCVGVSISPNDARNLRRLTLSVSGGLLGSWLLPIAALAMMTIVGGLWNIGPVGTAFLAGAVLVVAMPPANSASVWSELSGGQAAMTLWVIILGTLVSPLVTPAVVSAFAGAAARPELLAAQSSGGLLEVLFAFVMLPAALGVALRALLDAFRNAWTPLLIEFSRTVSLAALLLLNYINAAAALPQLVTSSFPAAAAGVVLLTFVLCGLVFALSLAVGRWAGLRTLADRLSFTYVVGMKNTGAALVLASSLLATQPLAVLVPVLYTLAQHFAAAMLDRVAARPVRTEAIDAPPVADVGPMLASRS
jgi:BASS family bile acid:Na+ symporter